MSSNVFEDTNEQDSDKITLVLDEIYALSKKAILKVKRNLDDTYGAYSEKKKNHLNQLHDHLKVYVTTFFEDAVSKSNRDKNNIIKYIEELLTEKEVLEKELQVGIGIDDYSGADPLIDVQNSIGEALQKYRQIKEERMDELNKLQEEEKHICQLLSEKPKYSGLQNMPSATQLENIKRHVIDLKNIKVERRAIYLEQRAEVESLIAALGEMPISEFDKMVLGDPNKFQLSRLNLDELRKLITNLKDQTENQKSMATELKAKLNLLWDRLQIDVSYREHFLSTKKGYGIEVIKDLRIEVERCETLKKENIEQFIGKLRSELNDLWDRCNFGERQRKQCRVYYNTECNKDIMDSLDMEVDNAKKFYNDNISIYRLIEEREQLWNKMIMMQEQANDPVRLWHNRGGQLLKEEKDRKVIQKELPRVEKVLKDLLQLYEQKEGKLFLFKDERLLDVIDRQWNENKSNEKNVQPSKSKIQTGVQSRVQTPQTATRNKRKLAPASYNQASQVISPRQLFNGNNNVAKLVPLNSTKLTEVNVTTTKRHAT